MIHTGLHEVAVRRRRLVGEYLDDQPIVVGSIEGQQTVSGSARTVVVIVGHFDPPIGKEAERVGGEVDGENREVD